MGPRLFSRGNCYSISLLPFAMLKLQWGHGFSAVEIVSPATVNTRSLELQWGHGFSAVEIVGPLVFQVKIDNASMGPRLFSRGNQ